MTYPTIRPELTLDFANSRQLDPRISFSRSSGATYLNPDTGLITLASDHEARFEKEGLLIEESRINLITYSEDTTNAAWNHPRSTQTVGGTAPDGTDTANDVTVTGSGFNGSINQIFTLTGKHAYSVFIKKKGFRYFRIGFSSEAVDNIYYDIDTNEFSNQGSNVLDPQKTVLSNGWVRLSAVFTLPDPAVAGSFLVFVVDNPNNTYTTVNGTDGFYMWGAQVEESFPTSYIPTSGSALTRSADIAQITGDNFSSWYGGLAGTYTVEALNKTTINHYPIVCDNGTTGTRILFATSGAYQLQIKNNGSTSVQLGAQPGAGQPQGMTKYAGSYSPDGASIAYGGVSNTDSTADIPQCSRLQIGQFSGESWNVTISRISYYPRRLTDLELQTLTL